MKRTFLFSIFFSLWSAACYAGQQPAIPQDAFGFDWLKPESAKCEQISQSLHNTFGDCLYQSDGAFGLNDPIFKCRINDQSEFLVFEDKSACERNLETMLANAP